MLFYTYSLTNDMQLGQVIGTPYTGYLKQQ
ncbi:hypothetical protein VULLAG_LOCUS8984 [Vulpes lagopus]